MDKLTGLRMNKSILTVFIFLSFFTVSFSQDTARIVLPAKVINGDTVGLVDMRAAVIFPPVKIETHRQQVRYDKLVRNVKKVYPYAKLAGAKLRHYRDILDTIPTEKARKLFMKKAQSELEAQFGDEIKDLTFSQGKILIKLVYRETGNSTFDIVKDLRGGFSAFIWQTMARIFGYDLKKTYDPAGEDEAIEQIILMIEAGAI
jgi:hypothetical protein